VATAADGDAALEALAAQAPDLVILDVMLPKMNGFDVCRRIKADHRWKGIRVLILTARGRDTEVSKGLGLGADLYVTKPFSTKELMAQVRELLAAGR
jgi:DNA-binding response OmpR family regulator